MKIIVTENFTLEPDQVERLKSLGEVFFLKDKASSKEESLKRLSDADILCAESEPIEDVMYELKDKFISFPFVGVGWIDLKKLSENNVRVANAPGCNKMAVSEWILGMMIILSRKLLKYIDIEETKESDFMEAMPGLAGKKVTILGKGNIGLRVGKICEAFDMTVTYFKRGDNLIESTNNADFIVNCLAKNTETEGMIKKEFFEKLKRNSFFISITDTIIYDVDALINELESGHLAGAAIDPAGVGIFDVKSEIYQKLKRHPKIIVTPHIAFHTDMTTRVANDIMIDNVEAWVKGKPQNILN